MAVVIVKSLDHPDERLQAGERGHVELVTLAGATVGRASFEPGWRWSEQMKVLAGTELCQLNHTGYVVSGREMVRMADGSEFELGPGDAFEIGAGHDAWVLGDEPCVTIDFTGIGELARAS